MLRRRITLLATFTPIYMPALSPSMTKGKIIQWNKKVGDTVAPGDVLAKVETDKASMDFKNSSDEGILGKIFIKDGEDATVTQVVAVLVEEAAELKDVDQYEPPAVEGAEEPKAEETPKKEVPKKAEAPKAEEAPKKASKPADHKEAISRSGPAVQNLAHSLSDDQLKSISASGKDGRFTKGDFLSVTSLDYEQRKAAAGSQSSGASSSSSAQAANTERGVFGSGSIFYTTRISVTPVNNFKAVDDSVLSKLLGKKAAPAPTAPAVAEAKA